jgi:hypothetical protein
MVSRTRGIGAARDQPVRQHLGACALPDVFYMRRLVDSAGGSPGLWVVNVVAVLRARAIRTLPRHDGGTTTRAPPKRRRHGRGARADDDASGLLP